MSTFDAKKQETYCGRILSGQYSDELQQRIRSLCAALVELDRLAFPACHYLSAWKENEKIIWYEYAGHQLTSLLGCEAAMAAEFFRDAIIDWRVYHYVDRIHAEIQEKILSRDDLKTARSGLREEVQDKGTVEAVYKIADCNGNIFWLKDLAVVETFEQDGICLSLGSLTDISKEMAQKDLLEKIGFFDELTKLPKRNILNRILDINFGQFQRKQIDDFSFLMMDIDYFKSVNDTYGHPAGDRVLVDLAEVMSSIKRKEDEIGRYGGEEFYGVCLGGIKNGIEFAERLRSIIESHSFQYRNQAIPITISSGVVAASELADADKEQLIHLADQRLYLAKGQGRNRVVGG